MKRYPYESQFIKLPCAQADKHSLVFNGGDSMCRKCGTHIFDSHTFYELMDLRKREIKEGIYDAIDLDE